MWGFNSLEWNILKRLNTPAKVQDFLETIPANFEKGGETCLSPRRVLREWRAHCMEGAMLAAVALRVQGFKPLVIDLKSNPQDDDHVVAVFKLRGCWGAISKTNHAVLRYREPIYRSLRELVMSYWHEYFTNDGVKTLRSYSRPLNLARFDKKSWMISEQDLWYIPSFLDKMPHVSILTPVMIKNLRLADKIERQVGKIIQYKR